MKRKSCLGISSPRHDDHLHTSNTTNCKIKQLCINAIYSIKWFYSARGCLSDFYLLFNIVSKWNGIRHMIDWNLKIFNARLYQLLTVIRCTHRLVVHIWYQYYIRMTHCHAINIWMIFNEERRNRNRRKKIQLRCDTVTIILFININ